MDSFETPIPETDHKLLRLYMRVSRRESILQKSIKWVTQLMEAWILHSYAPKMTQHQWKTMWKFEKNNHESMCSYNDFKLCELKSSALTNS